VSQIETRAHAGIIHAWRALFSLQTDHNAGLTFGDTGFCNFLATQSSIEIGKLTDVYFYEASF
jgi:hypothetical protein